MKATMIFSLMMLTIALTAFDLEYIRPVPLNDDVEEAVEEPAPVVTEEPAIGVQNARAYVNGLDYKTYDWELFKNSYLGNTEVVRILLERDANPNVQLTATGVSVLQAALFSGNSEIADMLIEKGANCIHRDKFHRIPLFYAVKCFDNLAVVEKVRRKTDLIYSDQDWRSASTYAAVYENLPVLLYFLDDYVGYGGPEDHNDRGPGEYAAANGKLDIIRQMVNMDMKYCSIGGILDYAIAAGAVDIVDYVLASGKVSVDPSHLVIAALGLQSFNDYGIYSMQVSLSDPGSYIIPNYQSDEPVFYNTTSNYHAIFTKLLDRVSDPNGKNVDGITPLIASAMANDDAKARMLIDQGASPFLRYKDKAPLDFALANPDPNPALINLLKQAMK